MDGRLGLGIRILRGDGRNVLQRGRRKMMVRVGVGMGGRE
jgi:hypothetical protein